VFPSRERALFDKFTHHRRNWRPFLRISVMTLAFAMFGEIGVGRAQAVQRARADSRLIRLQTMPSTIRLPVEGKLPSLGNATAWINSEPLTAASLRGKVVLVEFWTYSCINWRRQLGAEAFSFTFG